MNEAELASPNQASPPSPLPGDASLDHSLLAFERAIKHHAEGDYAKAVDFYEDISAQSPAFLEGQHFLGIALHHLGQHEQAVRLLTESLSRAGGRADWANNLGNILTAQGRFNEAVDVFKQALEQAPDQALLWINLGATLERLEAWERAETAYQTAMSIEPQSPEPYRLLTALYQRQNKQIEAVRAYCAGYIVAPRATTTPYLLGKAYYVLGRLEEAAEVYLDWKRQEPNNPIPAHLYAACARHTDQGDIPERCSEDYVNVTFDDYADHFDGKLSQLNYRGPALLEEMLSAHIQPDTSLTILDAGCGTGLCAPMLKPYARRLVGVDLSGSMLELAQHRALYDNLHKAEIGHFLTRSQERYDLIACMDTLIYFGAIAPLFGQFAASLLEGGRLIFTTELCEDETKRYRLNPSGRYSHSASYLHSVMADNGFACRLFNRQTLRTELDMPVAGVIVLAQRL